MLNLKKSAEHWNEPSSLKNRISSTSFANNPRIVLWALPWTASGNLSELPHPKSFWQNARSFLFSLALLGRQSLIGIMAVFCIIFRFDEQFLRDLRELPHQSGITHFRPQKFLEVGSRLLRIQ